MEKLGKEAIRVFEATIDHAPADVRADLVRAVRWAEMCFAEGLVDPRSNDSAKTPTLRLWLPGERRGFVTIWNDGAKPQVALYGDLIRERAPTFVYRAAEFVSPKPLGKSTAAYNFSDQTFQTLTSMYRAVTATIARNRRGQSVSTQQGTRDGPVETQYAEWAAVHSTEDVRTATRAEHKLVMHYKEFLEGLGDAVGCKIIVTPEGASLRNDLFNQTRNQLVEAKASVARSHVRMGIGQLLDYRRYVELEPDMGLLLPERPDDDLISLLDQLEITAIWRAGVGWKDSSAGAFA